MGMMRLRRWSSSGRMRVRDEVEKAEKMKQEERKG